jgi:hypothetical protein
VTSKKQDMEKGIEPASKVTRKSMRIASRLDKPEDSGMYLFMASSAESDAGSTITGNSQRNASSDIEELVAYPYQRRPREGKGS